MNIENDVEDRHHPDTDMLGYLRMWNRKIRVD